MDDPKTPQLLIVELRYFNAIVEPDSAIQRKRHLIVPYQEKDISFHLKAITHRRPAEITYAWQLIGQDDDWLYSSRERTARYTNLRPGEYTFQAKAANYDGVWGEPAILRITVTSPFWMQAWFLLLSVGVLTALIAGITREISMRKIREEQRKLEVQKRIFAERERIARDLHDNVGAQISNIITGIEMYRIKQKTGAGENPDIFFGNIDLEARTAMSELRETIWLMDQNMLTLGDFVRQVRAYLAKAGKWNPDMTLTAKLEGDPDKVLVPSQSMHLFRVIQEACNNTRKHAKANRFSVLFRQNQDQLKVVIEDDGMGMDVQAATGKGNGLMNMGNRMQEIQAHFEIKSEPGGGTRIEIHLPGT